MPAVYNDSPMAALPDGIKTFPELLRSSRVACTRSSSMSGTHSRWELGMMQEQDFYNELASPYYKAQSPRDRETVCQFRKVARFVARLEDTASNAADNLYYITQYLTISEAAEYYKKVGVATIFYPMETGLAEGLTVQAIVDIHIAMCNDDHWHVNWTLFSVAPDLFRWPGLMPVENIEGGWRQKTNWALIRDNSTVQVSRAARPKMPGPAHVHRGSRHSSAPPRARRARASRVGAGLSKGTARAQAHLFEGATAPDDRGSADADADVCEQERPVPIAAPEAGAPETALRQLALICRILHHRMRMYVCLSMAGIGPCPIRCWPMLVGGACRPHYSVVLTFPGSSYG